MDGRNDKAANNQYELWNCEHSKRNDVLSISGQGSGKKEEDKEEEEEVVRPQQRRRVDQADNKDPGEILDVPIVIDYAAFALNPEGTEGGHEENNGQRGTICDNEG